jgi:hypothetical protein
MTLIINAAIVCHQGKAFASRPQRRGCSRPLHTTMRRQQTLQGPTGYCCLGKQSLFTVRTTRNTQMCTVCAERKVQRFQSGWYVQQPLGFKKLILEFQFSAHRKCKEFQLRRMRFSFSSQNHSRSLTLCVGKRQGFHAMSEAL